MLHLYTLGPEDETDEQVAFGAVIMIHRLPSSLILLATLSFCDISVSLRAHSRSSLEVTGCDLALSSESELLIPLVSLE